MYCYLSIHLIVSGLVVDEIGVIEAILFVLMILFLISFLIMWLSSYQKLKENDGAGSQKIYDFFVMIGIHNFYKDDEKLRYYLAPDPVGATCLMLWLTVVMTIVCLVFCVRRFAPLTVLTFISCALVTVACYYVNYTSYPETMFSMTFYHSYIRNLEEYWNCLHFNEDYRIQDNGGNINTALQNNKRHHNHAYDSVPMDGHI